MMNCKIFPRERKRFGTDGITYQNLTFKKLEYLKINIKTTDAAIKCVNFHEGKQLLAVPEGKKETDKHHGTRNCGKRHVTLLNCKIFMNNSMITFKKHWN